MNAATVKSSWWSASRRSYTENLTPSVAPRYLENYLGWHRMLDAISTAISPYHILTAALGQTYQHSKVT
jgi:hypothetical protein